MMLPRLSLRQTAILAGVVAILSGWLLSGRSALAVPPACFPSCPTYSISTDNVLPTASGFSADVYYSTINVWHVYVCIGTNTQCITGNMLTDPAWTRVKDVIDGTSLTNITYSLLRANRTYSSVYIGAIEGGTIATARKAAAVSVSTWPLPTITPTTSAISSNSATLTWTTNVPSTSVVVYAPNSPPTWALQSNPGSATLNELSSTASGTVWAVGDGGMILKRSPGGSWTTQSSGTTLPLYTVDAFDDNAVFAAGASGTMLRTTNGGATWTNISNGSNAISSIHATTPTTAWATGPVGQIFYFDGSTWTTKYNDASKQLNVVTSLDNKNIWAAGTGVTVRSSDGGATWTVSNPTTADILSIATLDGQTLWLGGQSVLSVPLLLKSTDGGATWSTIASGPSPTEYRDLNLQANDDVWFYSGTKVGHYRAAASPQISLDSNAGTVLGGSIFSLTLVHGDQVLIGGQTAHLAAYTQAGSIQSDLSSVTSHAVQLTGLAANQTYYFSAESSGSSVVAGAFGSFTTTSDTTPPTVAITAPAGAGTSYTKTSPYSVTGTAADTPPGTVQSVALTKNGTAQTVSGTTGWSSTVNLSAGANTLVATATDSSGNTGTDTKTLFFDSTNPTASFTSPTNGATVTTANQTITGLASDQAANDSGLASLTLTVNGSATTIPVIVGAPSYNWSASKTLAAGTNTLVITATDQAGNSQSSQITVTYTAPDFTLSASPASQSGLVGDVKTYTVSLTSLNSFSGAVSLTGTASPNGPTLTFSPASVTLSAGGTASSSLSVNTASASGTTYTITITGTSGALTKTTTVQLILNAAADFTLSATPSPLFVVSGQSNSYQVVVSANNTFAGPVAFSVSGLPTATTGTFNPASTTLANSQTNSSGVLNIATQASAASGSYTLTITGTGTNSANGVVITHTTTVVLQISATPDVTLSFLPASQTVNAGGTGTSYNGTITSTNGYSGTVNLTATVSPSAAGVNVSLAPNQVSLSPNQSKNTVLNASANHSVPGGTYVVTITASSGSVVRTTTVNLVVVEDTAPPVITNIVATPNYNNVRIAWTTDEPANSAITIFVDPLQELVIGTINDSATCTSTCHNLLYQPLNPSTTYYFSVTSIDTDPTAHSTTVATDASGKPLQFTTLAAPDTTAPTVTLTQPADSNPPSEVIGTVTVTGQATDDRNMQSVQITITNQTTGSTEPPKNVTAACTGLTCTYSYAWDTTQAGPAGNGIHTVTVVAKDAAGNLSSPVTHSVNVNNDYTNPVITSGPNANNLQCTATSCSIEITWTTDDPSTSEVGYQPSPPGYCDPTTTVCIYSSYKKYDDLAPTDASPKYTSHKVTLTGLQKNALYHFGVFSCNATLLCLQGAPPQ